MNPGPFNGNMFRHPDSCDMRRKIEALVADRTLGPADAGKLFTTRGAAGAIVVTLPTPAADLEGVEYWFFNVANQNLTITCDEKVISLNSAAADSVAFSTTNEKIGGCAFVICDGTSWLAFVPSKATATVTAD